MLLQAPKDEQTVRHRLCAILDGLHSQLFAVLAVQDAGFTPLERTRLERALEALGIVVDAMLEEGRPCTRS